MNTPVDNRGTSTDLQHLTLPTNQKRAAAPSRPIPPSHGTRPGGCVPFFRRGNNEGLGIRETELLWRATPRFLHRHAASHLVIGPPSTLLSTR